MGKFKKGLRAFHHLYFGKDDPVKHCEIYKREGCCHVDGILCDIKTCKELKEYRILHEL